MLSLRSPRYDRAKLKATSEDGEPGWQSSDWAVFGKNEEQEGLYCRWPLSLAHLTLSRSFIISLCLCAARTHSSLLGCEKSTFLKCCGEGQLIVLILLVIRHISQCQDYLCHQLISTAVGSSFLNGVEISRISALSAPSSITHTDWIYANQHQN